MSYKVEIFITNEEEGVNTQISASLEKAETALRWAEQEVKKLRGSEKGAQHWNNPRRQRVVLKHKLIVKELIIWAES